MLTKQLKKAIITLPIFILGIISAQLAIAEEEAPLVEPTEIGSLKGETVSLPDLSGIVKDNQAAIALGKALFFDINAGSDGQACASCHFAAGADNRIQNQVNPGELDLRGHQGWGTKKLTKKGSNKTLWSKRGNSLTAAGNPVGPNTKLHSEDFPFHQLSNIKDRNSDIIATTNDVVGSQGTHAGEFMAHSTGTDMPMQDDCMASNPMTFGDGSFSFRHTTGRNTPTNINAIFNHRSFWDGRANNVINGVDIWGPRNKLARLIRSTSMGGAELHKMRLKNASLASQAVGPILSDAEMSCSNRNFLHVAEKLLDMRALSAQDVSETDSALGTYVDAANALGLNKTYRQLIMEAFDSSWWDAAGLFTIDNSSGSPMLVTGSGHSQMHQNFTMFWGIAIMLWEAELISDDSPVDQFFDGTASLSPSEALGLAVFNGKGNCIACHSTAAFSRATTLYLTGTGEESIERMTMAKDKDGADTPAALYDAGFYNIGVTPTIHDVGLGGFDAFGNSLSFTRQYVRQLAGEDVPDSITVNPCTMEVRFGEDVRGFDDYMTTKRARKKLTTSVSCETSEPGEHGPVSDTFEPKGRWAAGRQRVAVDGAFKTPTLRNIGLTAPYFHNGGYKSLKEVVQFYDRGGNRRGDFRIASDGRDHKANPIFDTSNNGDTTGSGILGKPRAKNTGHAKKQKGSNLDANIKSLDLTEEEQDALVDFMLALTDDRVACMKPPFDAPALPLFKGQTGAMDNLDWGAPRSDDMRSGDGVSMPKIPATGEGGLEAAGVPCLTNSGNLFDNRNMDMGEM